MWTYCVILELISYRKIGRFISHVQIPYVRLYTLQIRECQSYFINVTHS